MLQVLEKLMYCPKLSATTRVLVLVSRQTTLFSAAMKFEIGPLYI